MKTKQYKNMKYLLSFPKDFNENEKYPLLLYLHGAGERGENVKKIKEHGYFKETKDFGLPFVVIAPLCENGKTWYDYGESLDGLLNKYIAQEFIDPCRIYGSGMSMGAFGIWAFAMSHADKFAAIIPVSGGGMCWNACMLKDVSIWAFHCRGDDVVSVKESENMINAVKRISNQEVKLTIYPFDYHDAWTATYSNRKIYEWLLSKKR